MSQNTASRATLSDVLVAIKSAAIDERRRQDMASAVRGIAKVLGRNPAEVPTDTRILNAWLRRASPKAMGMSSSRWNNVRSLLRSAIALVQPMMSGRRADPISEVWAGLYDRLTKFADRVRLTRLMRWLSIRQLTPNSLKQEDLEEFHRALCEEALVRDPEATWTDTTRAWNSALKRIPGWPQIPIVCAPRKNRYVLPWTAFPTSLKRDVETWLDRLAGRDFAEEGPSRPARPSTLATREYQLRAFASALVLRGRPADSLVSLAACLTLDNFVEGLRYFHERNGQRRTTTIHELASMLKGVARHWLKADDQTLRRMSEIVRKLAAEKTGMTQKNRGRLRAFDDTAATRKLLLLPMVLRREIERGKVSTRRRSMLGQVAVAIEILIFAPIRIGNLASIDMDRHLIKVGKRLHLVIPAAEVKNRADLDFELPEPSADLVRWYIDDVRRPEAGSAALFIGAAQSHKTGTLRTQIIKTIREYTGLEVHPHLFRHIGAKLYLDMNPGGYEVMRRVLGHKSMDTTTNFYAGMETRGATRHFDQQILKLRNADSAGRPE